MTHLPRSADFARFGTAIGVHAHAAQRTEATRALHVHYADMRATADRPIHHCLRSMALVLSEQPPLGGALGRPRRLGQAGRRRGGGARAGAGSAAGARGGGAQPGRTILRTLGMGTLRARSCNSLRCAAANNIISAAQCAGAHARADVDEVVVAAASAAVRSSDPAPRARPRACRWCAVTLSSHAGQLQGRKGISGEGRI